MYSSPPPQEWDKADMPISSFDQSQALYPDVRTGNLTVSNRRKITEATTSKNTAVSVFRIKIIWQMVLWIQILDWS
jgi:hypothetical protein